MQFAVLDGEAAVPCDPQSATAGLNSCPRPAHVGSLALVSDEEDWVLRNEIP